MTMRNQDVIAANREYFDHNAATYDREESCMVDARSQELVAEHLKILLQRMRERFGDVPLRVLDCGGGSGNLSLKLIDMGVVPELVDVSQAMIDIFLSKAAMRAPRTLIPTACSDLETFFKQSTTRYHLICFSSVLHHLLDYNDILDLAADHLEPGGIIYTIHDPSPSSAFWNRVEMADFHLSTFGRFVAYVRRRLGRAPAPLETPVVDESMAEPHVTPGIDDLALHDRFVRDGMRIVWHKRFKRGRTLLVTLLCHVTRHVRGFSFAVQKPE